MIICSCGVVADSKLRQAARENMKEGFGKVAQRLNLCQSCGRCGKPAMKIFREARAAKAHGAKPPTSVTFVVGERS